MGEIDSFGRSQRKGCIVIGALIVLLIGAVLFFSLGEFKSSGIFRSGKSSAATELYQLYPVQQNGNFYLVSVEGVFKTKIYNRQGGITMRSGSTDIRLSVYDLSDGKMVKRDVTGDFQEGQTKILGYAENALWTYDKENGLQSRSIPELAILKTQADIIAANNDLSSGLAKTDEYLNNFNELYAFNVKDNALFVTTTNGKQLWLNASSFETEPAPQTAKENNPSYSAIDDLIEEAMNGGTIDAEEINAFIRSLSIDVSSSHYPDILGSQVLGADSCTYTLEGNTIKTLGKINCPQPRVIEPKNEAGTFISPVFLSSVDPETNQYINPTFLTADNCLLLHAAKMGNNTELLLSLVQANTQKKIWTTKTGVALNNYKASYTINGLFGYGDTILLGISGQLFSVSLSTGKINWKTAAGNSTFGHDAYYTGIAEQSNKKYILAANSYFTELSHEGFFSSGRTDYRLQCIDALSGKIVKKQDVQGSESGDLPFYLGMSNQKCWFYTQKDGIHARSLPDLKITTTFADIKKNTQADISLPHTDHFGNALNENYIALDQQKNTIYITAENGLHYAIHTNDLSVSEVENPTDKNYEYWQKANTQVDFYRTMINNYFHHELRMTSGASVKLETQNDIGKLIYTENKQQTDNASATVASNQFIEANFIMNGISIDGNTIVSDRYKTPLLINKDEKALYLLYKDKISPEAHTIIGRYDINAAGVTWKYDISTHFSVAADLERIYTLNKTIIFIFKTHPELDDNYTAIAIDSESGKEIWNFIF